MFIFNFNTVEFLGRNVPTKYRVFCETRRFFRGAKCEIIFLTIIHIPTYAVNKSITKIDTIFNNVKFNVSKNKLELLNAEICAANVYEKL